MKNSEAVAILQAGGFLHPSREEYDPPAGIGMRGFLLLFAAQRLEVGDVDMADRATDELARLDVLFGIDLGVATMHDDNELPTGPCPAVGASEHEWTDVIGGDQCGHCGAFFIDWAAVEIADLRAQAHALMAQRDAARAEWEE